jgi:uncharacterized Rossmann fold enzyme
MLMDWAEWEPLYKEIQKRLELGFGRDGEAASLAAGLGITDLSAMENLRGETVHVFGCADSLPEAVKKFKGGIVAAADGATKYLLDAGITPFFITTDFDSDTRELVRAEKHGAIIFALAHGDNIERFQEGIRMLARPVVTVQCEPLRGEFNFGGFTDGDRAAFIANHFGAKRIVLHAFDFKNPGRLYRKDPVVKLEKLRVAEWLLSLLAERVPVEKQA